AGLGRGSALAVDHLRQDAGGGRVAGPSGGTEQEGVVQSPLPHRPDEGSNDMLLPHDLLGRLGPVLSIEGDVVGHGGSTLPQVTDIEVAGLGGRLVAYTWGHGGGRTGRTT